MRALSAEELLSVWERGSGLSPVRQALLVLAAACPESSEPELARLTVGQRDTRLLTLREWIFGSQLTGQTVCPHCGERLDLLMSVGEIRVNGSGEPSAALRVAAEGYEVSFRLPTSEDLLAISEDVDVAAGRARLLTQCVTETRRDGVEQPAEAIPEAVVERIAERMAAADPQADVQIGVTCPACGQPWQQTFDIVSYFWNEIDAWARRLLRDVHELASEYGWSEAAIVAMSPQRRQLYIDLIHERRM